MLRKPLIVISTILIAAAGGLIFERETANAAPQAQAPVGKNLQVLKFVKSRDQLKGWMRMIKNSLGVDCDYCHRSYLLSQTKPTKRESPNDVENAGTG